MKDIRFHSSNLDTARHKKLNPPTVFGGHNINGGIKAIWENKSNGELVVYNAYRVIRTHWDTKIENHKEMKKEIQILINRRKK